MRKFVEYQRISPKRKTAKRGTEINQTMVNTRYAKDNDIVIIKTFKDLDKSGKDLKREGLEEMMQFLREHDEIEGVLVSDQDRLTRDLRGAMDLIYFLRENNKRLIYPLDPFIDINTDLGELTSQLKAVFSAYDRKQTNRRLSVTIQNKLARGEGWGRKPPKVDEEKFLSYMLILNGNFSNTANLLKVSRSYLYTWVGDKKIDLQRIRQLIRAKEPISEIPKLIEGE